MVTQDKKSKSALQTFSEYVQALGAAAILAILIRGFVFEPFKIPSKSMVPTLLVGDFIFVARFQYGLRVPFTKYWLTEFSEPKRGDVVVFSYPEDEDVDFIKRVVGLPGDKITIKDDVLYINGEAVKNQTLHIDKANPLNKRLLNFDTPSLAFNPPYVDEFPNYRGYSDFELKIEDLSVSSHHFIQRSKSNPYLRDTEMIVPERSFFVMGDNRDQSMDSRFWGFVPRENMKGKAIFIWLSIDDDFGGIRWNRFGNRII